MRVRRTRRVAAPPERVWEVVSDPYALPRWWPRTQRVESVSAAGWTSVLGTDRGRSLRADWQVVTSEPPARRRWAQDLDGSPFAKLFTAHEVELRIAPREGGSEVSLEVDQALRGWARLAPFLVRGGARRQADAALRGLAELF